MSGCRKQRAGRHVELVALRLRPVDGRARAADAVLTVAEGSGDDAEPVVGSDHRQQQIRVFDLALEVERMWA